MTININNYPLSRLRMTLLFTKIFLAGCISQTKVWSGSSYEQLGPGWFSIPGVWRFSFLRGDEVIIIIIIIFPARGNVARCINTAQEIYRRWLKDNMT